MPGLYGPTRRNCPDRTTKVQPSLARGPLAATHGQAGPPGQSTCPVIHPPVFIQMLTDTATPVRQTPAEAPGTGALRGGHGLGGRGQGWMGLLAWCTEALDRSEGMRGPPGLSCSSGHPPGQAAEQGRLCGRRDVPSVGRLGGGTPRSQGWECEIWRGTQPTGLDPGYNLAAREPA